jgi:Uncharacterized protein conserved in bacteria
MLSTGTVVTQWGEVLVPESIVEIKKELDDRIGEPVLIKAQAGRKRVATHHGVLSKTYPAIFVVHLNDGNGAPDRILTVTLTYWLIIFR